MNRFLPLFILTGLLFGQDVLNLKSGESFEGTFYGKLGKDLVFQSVGDTETKKYPIWDVASIKTGNNEYFYPFDIPTVSSPEPTNKLKISPQKGLTVFGGFNQSKFSHNDDDGPDNDDIYNMSGYNLTVEKSFGMVRFGVGLNQRGTKLKSEESTMLFSEGLEAKITAEVEQTLNYLTLHAVYPYAIQEKITVFGGVQLGNGLGGDAKLKVSRKDAVVGDLDQMIIDMVGVWDYEEVDTEEVDAEDMELDYGLFLGVDYMINEKIGLRASYFKGLSDIFEESTIKNNTMSVSLLFSLRK